MPLVIFEWQGKIYTVQISDRKPEVLRLKDGTLLTIKSWETVEKGLWIAVVTEVNVCEVEEPEDTDLLEIALQIIRLADSQDLVEQDLLTEEDLTRAFASSDEIIVQPAIDLTPLNHRGFEIRANNCSVGMYLITQGSGNKHLCMFINTDSGKFETIASGTKAHEIFKIMIRKIDN